MFIQTEETPNPQTLKFLPGQTILPGTSPSDKSGSTLDTAGKPQEFLSPDDAHPSPLAERLFQIPGVEGVFFGRDFISVTKNPAREWYVMKPPILGAIMEHFVAKKPLYYDQSDAGGAKNSSDDVTTSATTLHDDADPIVAEIKELLESRIRPAVAMDGGDIVFEKFEDGVVFVRLKGACSGCPSSTMTLKSGIENMLKYYIPEVVEVQAV